MEVRTCDVARYRPDDVDQSPDFVETIIVKYVTTRGKDVQDFTFMRRPTLDSQIAQSKRTADHDLSLCKGSV